MRKIDLVIIGGGPAGMSAAVKARNEGIEDILILDRDEKLGGILQQCIHNGFGLHRFKEELTGPEYSWKYEEQVTKLDIPYMLNTMVLEISKDRIVTAVNEQEGIFQIQAGAIILAMGCRERSRGALNIPGTRPAGVYTAGTAQRFMNIKGLLSGKKVVILGSGDIGLIMARRMTLEGATVKMVCELLPYSGGLTRNIVQCLNDFNIPLRLSHTLTKIHGNGRVEGVTVAQVDEKRRPIPGTEEFVECDTLLLSVGLIPENELSKTAGVSMDSITSGPIVDQNRETSITGIFACGNVLHVHDLVDFVSEEAELAGGAAAAYLRQGGAATSTDCASNACSAATSTDCVCNACSAANASALNCISIKPVGHARYVVPQKITHNTENPTTLDQNCTANELTDEKIAPNSSNPTTLYFRVDNVHENVEIGLISNGKELIVRKKSKVAPGEMETFKLTSELLSQAQNNEIELFVREAK